MKTNDPRAMKDPTAATRMRVRSDGVTFAQKGTIVSVREIAKSTMQVSIRAIDDFRFTAGQYIWLMLPELTYPDPKGNTRMFSIASSPNRKGAIDIIFRAGKSGYKKTLMAMKSGAEIVFSGPHGSLGLPDDISLPIVLVAGGVGVAPFLSMVRFSTEISSSREIALVYVNGNEKEAAFVDELSRFAKDNSRFVFAPSFGPWDQTILEKFTGREAVWFVTGPSGFVDAVNDVLIRRGVPSERIVFEEFYPASAQKSKFEEKLESGDPGIDSVDYPYLLALDNASNHIVITDTNGIILYANKGAEVMTGYAFAEMKGNTPRLWGGLMPKDFYKDLWRTIKYERKKFYGEVKNRRKNQEEYYASLRISPIIDADGVLAGFFATEEDVTDQKNAERELANAKIAARNVLEDLQQEKNKLDEANAKDEAILASIGDGLVATDAEGKIVLVNNAFERMIGKKGPSITAKLFIEVVPANDEHGKAVSATERTMHKIITGEAVGPMTVTYFYQRNDGTVFPAAITVSPIFSRGKLIGAVEVFRDITREKEIDRMKTEFVNLASHQLRTPLTGIEWVVERFLKKEKLTGEGKGYLDDIAFSAKRLNALVRMLLNASRIETGLIEVLPEPIDVVAFTDEYLRECRMFFEKKKLVLVFPHPKSFIVTTDKNLFGHILQNLVSNSIEYTPPRGTIEIGLKKNDGTFLFTIRNTSPAIRKKDQKRIFEKFFRASDAVAMKPDGTGLGLYLVSEATKLLGGKVWFTSPTVVPKTADGEGAEGVAFFVELPLRTEGKEGKKNLVDIRLPYDGTMVK